MKLRNLFSTGLALFIAVAGLLCINPQVALADGPTNSCEWTGAGSDSNFSTVENWTNCGGGAPAAGDALYFGAVSTTSYTPVFDLASETNFYGIYFETGGFDIAGSNTLWVSTRIAGTDASNQIQAPIWGVADADIDGGSGGLTINNLTIGSESTVTLGSVSIGLLSGGSASSVINIRAGTTINTISSGVNNMNINEDFTGSGSYTAGQITVADGATFTDSGSVAAPVTIDSGGTLILDGTASGQITVANGGLVKGTGAGGTVVVQQGGTLAPGHSPGCLTTTTVSISGTYQEEIGGATTACTDFDQLIVSNTVNLTNGTLDTELVNGFKPSIGQTFEIVNNQGISPVLGTFKGLAQGATLTAAGYKFKISYVGGDGNDVTLTDLGRATTAAKASSAKAPSAPDTGLAASLSHPVTTLVATIVTALMMLIIARRLRPVMND